MKSKVAKRILAETPEETKIFVNLYADIVVRVNQLLKEKALTQKLLAEKLDKRPSEINKWLNGSHNFTLKSIAKIQAELGETIIYVPKRTLFISGNGFKKQLTVYKNIQVKKDLEFNKGTTNVLVLKKHQTLGNVS
jgi:transcriptional regulator with XRE-family HTH domain